jgi:hypothetical protein
VTDKPEKSAKKHALTPKMEAKKWQPGQSGNPAGRPKGSRNQFSEIFLRDFIAEWQEGGVEALQKCRKEDPATFLRVAASILPKELTINEGDTALERLLAQYTTDELDQLITGLCALGASGQTAKGKDEAATAEKPRKVH